MIHHGTINLTAVPYLVRWSKVDGAVVIEEALVFGVPLKDFPERIKRDVIALTLGDMQVNGDL